MASKAQRDAFSKMLKLWISGEESLSALQSANYEVRYIVEKGQKYTVLFDATEFIGPTIVLASSPCRDIIIESPHSKFDGGTDLQGVYALIQLGARALILSGAHRCASTLESPCSGRTSVCGDGRAPFRVSDVAHNPDTRFHTAHTMLAKLWPHSKVVQLHKFRKRQTDPLFILSNSTKSTRPSDSILVSRVRDHIRSQFDGAPEKAISCQDPQDKRYSKRRLCALTNVQGRHLNGSPNVCKRSSSISSGRFLHVEQQAVSQIDKESITHWKDMERYPIEAVSIKAIGKALPISLTCTSPSSK